MKRRGCRLALVTMVVCLLLVRCLCMTLVILNRHSLAGYALLAASRIPDHHGNVETELIRLEKAASLFRQAGSKFGESLALNNIGVIHRQQGNYQQALECYQQSLDYWRELERWASCQESEQEELDDMMDLWCALMYLGEAPTLNNIGLVYSEMGDCEQALEYLQQALVIARENDMPDWEAGTLNIMGMTYRRLGQYQKALEHLQQSLALRGEVSDRRGEAYTLNNMGMVYAALGDEQQAQEYFQQALAICRAIRYRAGEAVPLNNIGLVYSGLDDQRALEYFRQALDICRESGDRAGEAVVLENIGVVHHRLGEYQQALESYHSVWDRYREIGARAGEARALTGIGIAYGGMNDYPAALEHCEQALTIERDIGYREGEVLTLVAMGLLYEDQGNNQMALIYYRRALSVVESLHGEITVPELAESLLGGLTDMYAHTILLLARNGHPEEAFDYTERGRARAFLDMLGNRRIDVRHGAAAELLEREEELRSRLAALEARLLEEQSKPVERQSEEAKANLVAQLESGRREYEEALTVLKVQAPEYASLVTVDPLPLSRVQAEVLDGQTTLIEYYVTEEKTLAWVVDEGQVRWVELPVSREELHARIGFLRAVIAQKGFDYEVARGLYEALFAPLEPHVRHGRLVVVPHGPLHLLPFAALWDGERFLAEEYVLSYAPSASALYYARGKHKEGWEPALVLGDPDGTLPYARAEAEGVAGLLGARAWVGGEARESLLGEEGAQARVIHLAVHGRYDPVAPLYSRLYLAGEGEGDGVLEVYEVYGLDLGEAELVVLSACETGVGEATRGDEVVSLARAFMVAGAPSVVGTLWRVDDEASGELMEEFYSRLLRGERKGAALRGAQLAVMEEHESPYFWAPFILVGDE